MLSSMLIWSSICKRYCGVPPTRPYTIAISSGENRLKYLQQENIRECKILATLIMPAADFTASEAMEWAATLSTVEMAETAVFNLFQHMTEAEQFSLMLLANEDKLVRICAYNLVCRLLKRNNECTPQLYAALFKKAAIDLKSADRQLLYPLVKCLDYVSSTDTEQAKEATQLLKEAGFGAF